MGFVTPLMLLGLLGAAIPIAMHLIGKQRAKVVRFSAIDYLLGTDKKLARQLRIREWLLLLSRVLLCMLLALALAKPYASCATDGPTVVKGPQAAVLVIDNSLAAGYELAGESLLSQEKRLAEQILQQLGTQASVAVVLSVPDNDSRAELSQDHMLLRDKISNASLSRRPTRLQESVSMATELLLGAKQERKTVYVISPLRKGSFVGEESILEIPDGIALELVDIAKDKELPNTAILNGQFERDPNAGTRGVRFSVELANYGNAPVDEATLRLSIDDDELLKVTVSLKPGETKTKVLTASLPEGARDSLVTIRLEADDLDDDNKRYLVTRLRDEIPTLLVNGDSRSSRHEDELFYLHAALRPGDRNDSGTMVHTIIPQDLSEVDLAEYDVVVLANVEALDTKLVEKLRSWVEGGGGLFVTLGDHVDVDAYNKSMSPLLPQELRTIRDTVYGKTEAEKAGHALRLAKLEHDHPIFSIFSKDAPALRESSFGKIALLGPTTKVQERRVLARFDNGASALVGARIGKGQLILLASSVDRDWNDLAIHPGYLPLMQQIVRFLARKESAPRRREVFVGSGISLPVFPDDRTLEVKGPADSQQIFDATRLKDKRQIRFNKTLSPGFYRLFASDTNDKRRERIEGRFAVNIDTSASQLQPAQVQLKSSGAASKGEGGDEKPKTRVELWHTLAALLLAFLVIEGLLAVRAN